MPSCSGSPASASCGNLAHAVLPSVSVLYMAYRYGWDERIVGFTMAGVGVCAIVVQGGVVGAVTTRFGERAALIIGLAFGVAGFAVFGLAPTGVGFWLGIPLLALWGLASPASIGSHEPRASAARSRARCRAPTPASWASPT